MSQVTDYTMDFFYGELKKKVSATNAKLLLHTAAVKTGYSPKLDTQLRKEDAEAICMELIRSGGPGFQVGRAIYSQMMN
jgi:hypothetical protein